VIERLPSQPSRPCTEPVAAGFMGRRSKELFGFSRQFWREQPQKFSCTRL
jgi:hypothetical protein